MYNIPSEYFISPVSRKPLVLKGENLLCDSDGNEFPRHPTFGFWNFIPKTSPVYSQADWKTWESLIANFEISYQKDPTRNVSYDERPDALAFGDFCNYRGKVLDLGSGPHRSPSYIHFKKKPGVEFFGLDPFPGEHPKEYLFVQGIGEHVPFKDELFDITIYATSLHHFIDPRVGIREALRVTKQGGYLCVWVGDKSKEAPAPAESPEWYQQLATPQGAENPFHFHRFSAAEFEGYVADCNFQIIEKQTLPVDRWRKNVFFRISH